MGYSYYSPGATLVSLLIVAGLAFIPANIAKKKGYSFGGFWVFGFFFFLIALIVSLCLNYKPEFDPNYQYQYAPPPPPPSYGPGTGSYGQPGYPPQAPPLYGQSPVSPAQPPPEGTEDNKTDINPPNL